MRKVNHSMVLPVNELLKAASNQATLTKLEHLLSPRANGNQSKSKA